MIKRLALVIFLIGLAPVYAGSGGELAPDVPVQGEIAERGEKDVYTFSGENDQRITLRVTANSSLDTVLELYDPAGEFLASNDDADPDTTNSQIEMTLTSDGEYRVVVQAFAGATVGEYELVLSTGEAPTAQTNSTVLTYNETRTGVLDGGAALDYTFTGSADERLSILVIGEIDSLLEVYSPSGEQIASDDDGGPELNPFIRNLILPEDGDYTLTLRSYPTEPTGDYEISIFELTLLEAQITYDSSADGTIDENQITRYEFEGAVGDSLEISLNGEFDTYLQVRNSAGALIGEDDDSGGNAQAALTLTLSQNDTYTIEVMGFSPTEFGDYTLNLTLTNQISTLDGNQRISYGETIEAALGGGETATLTFTATAGDVITVVVTASFDSQLNLYDPSGELVANDDDSGTGLNPQLENIALTETGDYQLELQGYAEEEGGRFSLTLSSGDSIVSPSGEGAITIAYGETATSELAAGQIAEYLFAGTAGETVTIRVVADFDSFTQLFQPNGNLLTSDDDSGGDLNPLLENISLNETGDYRIILRAFDPSISGTYSLSLEVGETSATDDVTIMVLGDTLTGRVEIGETSQTVFNGTAGDLISVSASVTNWLGDPDLNLRVLQPNGDILAQDDNSGWLSDPMLYGLELPETGTYTIEVGLAEGSSGGDFTLTLAEGSVYLSPNGRPAEVLDLSDGYNLELDLGANVTLLYQFEANAGEILEVLSSSTDLDVSIYSPLIFEEYLFDPNLPQFEIPTTGTYLLLVFTQTGGQGNINLQLGDVETPVVAAPIEPFATPRGEVVADRPLRGTLQNAETQIWTFKPLLTGTYSILLNSEDAEGRFDPFVKVRGADGTLLAQDDDSGGNFNALVENLDLVAEQTITVEISGFADQRGGNYLLVVVSEAVEPPPILRGGRLTIGSVVDNALLIPSQRIAFELQIPDDGNYTITLTGLKLPYVDISDADGNLIARGVSGLIDQTLSAGTYTLTIYDRLNRTGGFSLSIE